MVTPALRQGLYRRRTIGVAERRTDQRARLVVATFAPTPFPEVIAPLVERYPAVPFDSVDEAQHRIQIARATNRITQGKMNIVGEMTIVAGSTATILRDDRIGTDSFIEFYPLTANAALEKALGGMWSAVEDFTSGQVLVHHISAGSTDRSFRYAIVG